MTARLTTAEHRWILETWAMRLRAQTESNRASDRINRDRAKLLINFVAQHDAFEKALREIQAIYDKDSVAWNIARKALAGSEREDGK